MSIQRYNTFAIDGSQTVSKDEGGEFVYYKSHARGLAVMQARAERAEHFVRLIAGLRSGNIGESEAGQLVRTAKATLQPITTKGTQ